MEVVRDRESSLFCVFFSGGCRLVFGFLGRGIFSVGSGRIVGIRFAF